MKRSQDESQIREQLQRLKRTDEEHAPAFDDVLNRHVRAADRPASRRVPLVLALSTAAMLLVIFGLMKSREDIRPDPRSMTFVPDDQLTSVDFDYFRQLVDEHFELSDGSTTERMPVWSSRTESLLAVNLDAFRIQEQP